MQDDFKHMRIVPKGTRTRGIITISGKCDKCGSGMRQFFEDGKVIEICQGCGNFKVQYMAVPKMIFPNYGDVKKHSV